MKKRTELEKHQVMRIIERDPDTMCFMQKICWLVLVWTEDRIRKIEKEMEEQHDCNH